MHFFLLDVTCKKNNARITPVQFVGHENETNTYRSQLQYPLQPILIMLEFLQLPKYHHSYM